ncbi:MAG: fatty acid desaturase [Acidobacteria bacterium]|nr:fatty acid desaturase [Acidobacteriota bacterium]
MRAAGAPTPPRSSRRNTLRRAPPRNARCRTPRDANVCRVPAADYIRVEHPEPHVSRGREMLAVYPELRALAGPQPASAAWIAMLVAAQMGLALALGDRSWHIWLPVAYIIGATIDHALWVLIHECAHNLIFQARLGNRVAALTANLPLVFPAAMSFCKYHLLHHRHMGEIELDADIAGPTEARVVGRSSLLKTLWLAGFVLVVGTLRPRRLTRVPFVDRWTTINMLVQVAAMTALVAWAGWAPMKYLVASSVLAIGFHPLGARWIQEHYVFSPGQETYSYYGPLNRVSFNGGYHNEHHDLVAVPWSRLPRIRAIAPEFYDGLQSHGSWTALLVAFLRDRDVTLFSRVVRSPRGARAREP